MKHPHDIRNYVKLPDWISLGNALSGFLSIILASKGLFWSAAGMIVVAAIFDFFDGRVARKYNLSSEFGVQLDSLCDTVSFLLAPAFFAYSFSDGSWISIIFLSFFVLAGIARLARFNVTGTTEEESGKFFEGVPVPVSLILPFLLLLFQFMSLPMYVGLAFYVIHGILMISVVKIPKL
jgi:CDP-diacylglycerol--serine O-phosphatidyltransferase